MPGIGYIKMNAVWVVPVVEGLYPSAGEAERREQMLQKGGMAGSVCGAPSGEQ